MERGYNQQSNQPTRRTKVGDLNRLNLQLKGTNYITNKVTSGSFDDSLEFDMK